METIRDILETKGKGLFSIEPEETVLAAVDEMCRRKVGALLVKDASGIVGIFSERDVLTRIVLTRRDPAATKVREVMTADVVCVGTDERPEHAMAIMTSRRCRHLPVVVDRQVVGLVSIGDLVRWTSRHMEAEMRTLEEYVSGKYPG
jgi:CBS domain-containing protein